MLVSAGPLHQAGAAENKDVIHGPADNLQRDTWGRQPLGPRSGEGDGSFVPTLHRGTRGGLLTVGLFTTSHFSRGCSRPEFKTSVSSNHSRVLCSAADVIG